MPTELREIPAGGPRSRGRSAAELMQLPRRAGYVGVGAEHAAVSLLRSEHDLTGRTGVEEPQELAGIVSREAAPHDGHVIVAARFSVGLGTLKSSALFVLFLLPSTDLVLRHVVEEAVLVMDSEPPGGEPPLDRPPDRGPAAPAPGITAALTVTRVVDAPNESPSQPREVSARTEPQDRETADGVQRSSARRDGVRSR
jgi:hypothetical protein